MWPPVCDEAIVIAAGAWKHLGALHESRIGLDGIVSASCAARGAVDAPGLSRSTVYRGELGLVERLCCAGHDGEVEASSEFQFGLVLSGSFLWHAGRQEIYADPNQVLYITGGESYRISHPVAGDDCLLIQPGPELLEELIGHPPSRLHRGDHFRRRARTIDAREQLAAAQLWFGCAHPLALEETLAALMSRLADNEPAPSLSPAVLRTVRRARQVLVESLRDNLSLTDIGRHVGVSPLHLTTLFKRVLGIPLHQYLRRLRLATALRRLPHEPDLTRLALELGFCSHSHFTNAFRQTYGVAPSRLRARWHRVAADDRPTERDARGTRSSVREP